jgi:glucose-6-phosphate isomerase
MKQSLRLTLEHIPSSPQIGEGVVRLTETVRAIMRATGPYVTHEHALRLPFDVGIRSEVTRIVERYWNTQLKYVLVVGIGGSNLGAQAIYEALRGTHDELATVSTKIIFLDTVSVRVLHDIEKIIVRDVAYPEEIVVNIISKSGATTESIVNMEVICDALERHLPEIRSRIVVTTDHGSKLWKVAEHEHFGLLSIPKEVGGRFSVFTPAGLFPLALAGIKIEELCDGAREALESSLCEENVALRFATALYRSMHHGVSIVNFFFFNPELESLGKWARQLYGESLGKERDRSGAVVHAGITPLVSIGSTDLHSMAQLYLGGPRDKFTLFVRVPEPTLVKVPPAGVFLSLVPGIACKTPDEIMGAIYQGVKAAYGTHRLPSGEILLASISPYTLGQFLEFHMLTVMYLGEMLHVNTFDQPNVEDYKRVTRSILEKN